MLSGCGNDGLTPPEPIDPSKMYWTLELNHHAVALAPQGQAPYDTLTLIATPRTSDGMPLDGLPAATYVSGDPETVGVGSDGVLRGLAPTLPGVVVPVVATLTAGNLKHVDTVRVTVLDVDPRPVLASLSIHPTPNNEGYADSAKVAVSPQGTGDATTCFALPTWTETPLEDCGILLPVTVLDTRGIPIPGVPIAFRSSDKEVASVHLDKGFAEVEGRISVGSRAPAGQVTFYASTTIFGVTKVDTLPFRIGWPVVASINVDQGFENPVLQVGVGAMVAWTGDKPFVIDINFADPTNVLKLGQPPPSFVPTRQAFFICAILANCEDAGNIVLPAVTPGGLTAFAVRRFPVPGTYDYSSTALGGASGRIIVVDER